MISKEYLLELGADARFQMILEAMNRARPSIPEYRLGQDVDEWKYRSGMRAGFDLALTFLGVKAHE